MSDSPVYRSPYNPGLPELDEKEIPSMKAAGTDALRLQGTLSKRLPAMPGGTLQDLYGTDYRAQAQAEESFAIGKANDITKAYNKRSSARAKARNRLNQKYAENRSGDAYTTRKKQLRNEKRREKGLTKYVARNVLGVGPDLYR